MIPEFGFPAEAAQLNHRQGKIEVIVLCLLHDGFVQLKGRHVLRRVGRDQPAVIANGNEYANFHHEPLFISAWGESQTWRCILHFLFSRVVSVLQRGCQF